MYVQERTAVKTGLQNVLYHKTVNTVFIKNLF